MLKAVVPAPEPPPERIPVLLPSNEPQATAPPLRVLSVPLTTNLVKSPPLLTPELFEKRNCAPLLICTVPVKF